MAGDGHFQIPPPTQGLTLERRQR